MPRDIDGDEDGEGRGDGSEDLLYPTPDGIRAIHDAIVARWDNTPGGTYHEGAIDHAVWAARRTDGDLHTKAAALLEILAMGHGFVDGNKRTATATALVFEEFNGRRVALDDDWIAVIKAVAGDAAMEPPIAPKQYFREHVVERHAGAEQERSDDVDAAMQRNIAERLIDAHAVLFDELSRT